jgi:hypothetical protein
MNCQKCGLVLDAGVKFCGNCGQAINDAQQAATVKAKRRWLERGGNLAIASLVMGVLSLPAGILLPFAGLPLSLGAVAFGLISRQTDRPGYAWTGFSFGVLAALISATMLWYVLNLAGS